MLLKCIIFAIVMAIIPYLCGCSVKALLHDRIVGAAYTYLVGTAAGWIIFGIIQLLLGIFNAPLMLLAPFYLAALVALIAAGIYAAGVQSYTVSLKRQLTGGSSGRLAYIMLAAVIAVMAVIICICMVATVEGIYRDSDALYEAVQIYHRKRLVTGTDALTGHELGRVMLRERFSMFPSWIAMMALLFRVSPVVAANTFMPIYIIPLMLMAYYIFSITIFTTQYKRYMFTGIVGMLAMFSNYALYPGQSVWNMLLVNCWEPDVIATGIIMPVIWYLAVTLTKMTAKLQSFVPSAGRKVSDVEYREAAQNKVILNNKIKYLEAAMLLACFVSLYSVVMSVVVCGSIFICYFVIRAYGDTDCIKKCMPAFVPALIYLAAVLADGMMSAALYPVSGFWQSYVKNLALMFDNNFKYNVYLVIFIMAVLCQYARKSANARSIAVYMPVIISVTGVFNPLVYLIFMLLEPDCGQLLFWLVPFNAIIAYSATELVTRHKAVRQILPCVFMYIVILWQFMPRFGYNFNVSRASDITKIPEYTSQICDIINESGYDKKVIAIDEGELCETLRLCDSDIELYYYADNRNAYGDDTDMYAYINQDVPYLQGIVNNAKRAGYNYIIVRTGTVDPNWASVLYHIWPLGTAGEYEVYGIGYF